MSSTRDRQRHSRKIVCTWLAVFLAVQFVFALALEGPLASVRHPEFTARSRMLRERMAETKDRPFLMVMGTSRSLNGIRAELISENLPDRSSPAVFNFAIAGNGPADNYILLKHLLREGIRPDGIVIELATIQLQDDLSKRDHLVDILLSAKDLRESLPFRNDPDARIKDWVVARSIPCYSYRHHFWNRYEPTLNPPERNFYGWRDLSRWGWLGIGFSKPNIEERKQYLDSYADTHRDFHVSPGNQQATRMLLELCRSEGIPAVVLFMPEGPLFRERYTAASRASFQAFKEWIHDSFRVPVVDASAWMDSEEWFIDSSHLLPAGATEFTRRFAREVVTLFGHPGSGSPLARSTGE